MEKRKVLNKQFNSDNCFICGFKNDSSLKTKYYELEDGSIMGLFTGLDIHQSYPDRMHGGVVAAVIDEAVGRAILPIEQDRFGVTIELTTKYRKPVPLNVELRVVAKTTKITHRMFEGEAQILLPDDTVAAEGWGKYFKIKIDDLVQTIEDKTTWAVDIPDEVEVTEL